MKKCFIIIALIFVVSFSLNAELNYSAQQQRIIDSIFSNLQSNSFAAGIFRTGSVREMKLIDAIWQYRYWGDDEWENNHRNVYLYNEQGLYDEVHLYYWDYEENAWERDLVFQKFYWNERGLLTHVSSVIDLGIELYEVMRLVQEFNSSDQIISAAMSIRTDELEWQPLVDFEFQYNYSNRCEYILFTVYDYFWEERNFFIERVELTYDYRHRMQTITITGSEDGENWENLEHTTYEYHQNDTSNYSTVQQFLNTLSLTMEQEMFTQTNRPMYYSEYYYEWIDEEWDLYERAMYHYHPNNKLEQIVWEYLGFNTWHPIDRELYYYDNNGNSTQVLFQYVDYEGNWTDRERVLLTMDEISSVDEFVNVPASAFQARNYPNPFNPSTSINFFLPLDQKLEVTVYNTKGQSISRLVDDFFNAGNHSIVWNGENRQGDPLPSGLYFYEIKGTDLDYRGKMMLLK